MQVSFFENLQILLCLKIAAWLFSGFNIDTKGLGILAMVARIRDECFRTGFY